MTALAMPAAGDDSPIDRAVAALPAGALDERSLQRHVAPLFARHREALAGRIYLANHSLGRPLDAVADDVREGLDAWYAAMGGAWDAWMAEHDAFRARLALLMHAPRADCVVPKTSAGQGLRAVLNTFDGVARVVSTAGEFDSLDVVLREYARRGRIAIDWVAARTDGRYHADDIVAAIGGGCDLVVLSEVMFVTGQRMVDLPAIVAAAHAAGARIVLDIYHSLGVLDVDVAALGVDYAVGGSYKYLRGGPGACFLYVAPDVLATRTATLDIGWFAKAQALDFARADPPQFAEGGDAWLESTPPVLTYFQSRAGHALALALGIDRLRDHSLRLQRQLVDALAASGVDATGASADRGAFVVVRVGEGSGVDDALERLGLIADVRDRSLRLCPDILTTADELALAAVMVSQVVAPPR